MHSMGGKILIIFDNADDDKDGSFDVKILLLSDEIVQCSRLQTAQQNDYQWKFNQTMHVFVSVEAAKLSFCHSYITITMMPQNSCWTFFFRLLETSPSKFSEPSLFELDDRIDKHCPIYWAVSKNCFF